MGVLVVSANILGTCYFNIDNLFKECTKKYRSSRLEATWFSTRDVYQLRKTLQGAVIGHIDRNIGELSVVCPVVYKKALGAAYSAKKGYTEIKPPAINSSSAKTHQWKS